MITNLTTKSALMKGHTLHTLNIIMSLLGKIMKDKTVFIMINQKLTGRYLQIVVPSTTTFAVVSFSPTLTETSPASEVSTDGMVSLRF